jgi:hypothetical protein
MGFEACLRPCRRNQAGNSQDHQGGRQGQTLYQWTQNSILPRAGTIERSAIEAPDNITRGAIEHAGLAVRGPQS